MCLHGGLTLVTAALGRARLICAITLLGLAGVGFAHDAVKPSLAVALSLNQSLVDMNARYRVAGPAERKSLEASMRAAAAARMEALASMIPDNTHDALAATLPLSVRSSLPSSLAAFIEQDAEIVGTLEI